MQRALADDLGDQTAVKFDIEAWRQCRVGGWGVGGQLLQQLPRLPNQEAGVQDRGRGLLPHGEGDSMRSAQDADFHLRADADGEWQRGFTGGAQDLHEGQGGDGTQTKETEA